MNFYLTARSNPIIEHCSDLGFGPFINPESKEWTLDYELAKTHAEQSGLLLEEGKNLFDKVLDFNWHKQDHSPNWKAIGATEETIKL